MLIIREGYVRVINAQMVIRSNHPECSNPGGSTRNAVAEGLMRHVLLEEAGVAG